MIAGCGLARSSLTDLFGILYALIRCGLSDRLGDDASHVLAPTIAIFEMLLHAAIASALEVRFEMPLSLLICQLVIAAGGNPEWITDVRATDGFCEIRRGAADIAPGTPISKYIGRLGCQVLGLNPD